MFWLSYGGTLYGSSHWVDHCLHGGWATHLSKPTHPDSSWQAMWVSYNTVSMWLLQVQVSLRVLRGYSAATGCAVVSEYPHIVPSKVLKLAVAMVVLHNMRPSLPIWSGTYCHTLERNTVALMYGASLFSAPSSKPPTLKSNPRKLRCNEKLIF